MTRKGIILAGGSGTRLYPVTQVVSKQLLPVYDKPMIYYPLSTLMLAGIRDILLISTPEDTPRFEQLLGDGARWGLDALLRRAAGARGLAQAFLIGRDSSAATASALVLGDNIFYGHDLSAAARSAPNARADGRDGLRLSGADPERYGVVEFDATGRVREPRGEAEAAEVALRGHRALLLRQPRARHRGATSSLRRAASSRSPTSTGVPRAGRARAAR